MYHRLFMTFTIAALAATGLVPTPAAAGPAPGVIQRLTDAATGTSVQVLRQRSDDLTITATSPRVTIERHLLGHRVITTLRAGGHVVSITPGAGRTVLRVDGRTIAIAAGDQKAAAIARDAVAGSPAVREAIDLLGRLALPVEQPVTSMLQLTRVALIGATGDAVGAFAVMEAMRADLTRSAMATRTSNSMESSCWPDYEKEAISAANDFVSCMQDLAWYDFWDSEACKAIYDMQAIGAFSEWANCVGLWAWK
jgi:hypothetical protein